MANSAKLGDWLSSLQASERGRSRTMNQNQHQQSNDGRHEDDASLSEFLASLMDYTPTVGPPNFSYSKFPSFSSSSSILISLYIYIIDLISDTWRASGALPSQEWVSMSRRSIVGTSLLFLRFSLAFFRFRVSSSSMP